MDFDTLRVKDSELRFRIKEDQLYNPLKQQEHCVLGVLLDKAIIKN